MAIAVNIKDLFEAGAHFGHKTSRWHPKMAPYIHSKRQDSHIINLDKTVENLVKALDFVSDMASSGKKILFVGTKKHTKDFLREMAISVNQPYVTERWIGGMLTNVSTINQQIKKLKDLERRMESGDLEKRFTKLEVQRYQEEIDKLNLKYGGIKDLETKPGAMFLIDAVGDTNAIKEAKSLSIPVIAVADTNADPSLVDYLIPANDDAIKCSQLIIGYVVSAIKEGLTLADKTGQKVVSKDKENSEA